MQNQKQKYVDLNYSKSQNLKKLRLKYSYFLDFISKSKKNLKIIKIQPKG